MVVAAESGGALGGLVRQLNIDQFENEGRRVSYGTPESANAARKLLDREMSVNSVSRKVIDRTWFGGCIYLFSTCIYSYFAGFR